MNKTVIRFFTIADYEDEEIWLREQHRQGWKMVKMTPPCFYLFESCMPEDVIYRLDYRDSSQTQEYKQLARDFGWEFFFSWMGWLYFRKPAYSVCAEGEDELLSDDASRLEMVSSIVRTRMIPIAMLFFVCVLPNLFNAARGGLGVFSAFFGIFFGVLFGIYVFLILHCGIKLKKIREKYEK